MENNLISEIITNEWTGLIAAFVGIGAGIYFILTSSKKPIKNRK